MKNLQIYADDHVCVQHCDTPAMLSTPQRSAQQYSRTDSEASWKEGAGD
jgi:hypothetical protein